MNSVVCSAPGRVNLMGEHTDYNGGFVLPTIIPQRTTVKLDRRTDGFIRVTSDIDPQAAYAHSSDALGCVIDGGSLAGKLSAS